jgi:hypothetical protein
MTSKGKKIIEDNIVQELILGSDSDPHISEDEISPCGSGIEKEETAYTFSTMCTYNPWVYGAPSGIIKSETPTVN